MERRRKPARPRCRALRPRGRCRVGPRAARRLDFSLREVEVLLISPYPLLKGRRMDIPTEKDWLDWAEDAQRSYELDEADAREQFAGKSFAEALEIFRTQGALMRSEDLSYMPPVPFRYYMLVFKAYVLELGKREIEERDLLDD